MDRFLSAEELYSQCMSLDNALPKRGNKSNTPDVSTNSDRLDERNAIISEARIARLSSLLRGEWLPDLKLVKITKNLGKHFHHMGFSLNGRNMLYPEEALYLMDTNCMEVYFNELPLSMQECFGLFLSENMSLEKYQVYSHLSRLGYMVVRYRSSRLKNENLFPSSDCSSNSSMKLSGDFKNAPITSLKRFHEDADEDIENTWKLKKMNTFEVSINEQDKEVQRQPSLVLMHPEINFPNVIGQKTMALQCPESRLLPTNVLITPKACYIDLKLFNSVKSGSLDEIEELPGNSNVDARVQTLAKSWKEYKFETNKSNEFEQLLPSKVDPLVTSKDRASTSSVLDKLSIIDQMRYQHIAKDSKCMSLTIDYDVYLPNTDYVKTWPPSPNHRLIVTRIDDELPMLNSIALTMESLGNDQVGLHFAVVDNGGVAFYSFNDLCIPRQISMG